MEGKKPAPRARKTGYSLAVLYLRNDGGSRKDEYFRDGVTEDIIIELSRLRGLSMLSVASVRAYRGTSVPAIQAGRELGASFVLDGSFRKTKGGLRVSVQLVETETGHTLWAERFDRKVEDIFAIQDEIAQAIAGKLRIMMTEEEKRALEKVPTTEVEAYDFYLRGRQLFRQFRRKSIEHAGGMFRNAIAVDPEYAGAYAGLADCHSYLYMFWDSSEENLHRADEASRRAVELDEDLAEARVSRGVAVSLGKRHDEAENEFRAAIRLNPSLFEAYYFFARGYYARGMMDRAVYWFRRACEANPEDYQAPTLLGSALRGLGLRAEAEAAYRKSIELAQKHLEVNPGETRALYFSAIALCQVGGRREQAVEWAERALAIDPEEPQVLYNVGCVYALLGMSDKAIDCLSRAITHGEIWRGWMANDPDLEILHGHPRFKALARAPEPA
jgi:TolB-like protein/Flp pilus assembly protein TadD